MPRAAAKQGLGAQAKPAAKKPRAPKGHKLPEPFPNGEILKDILKKEWKLGSVIGQGGFGLIYLASDDLAKPVVANAEYVVKIEPHSNGPLFCELHFYQRVCRPASVDEWMKGKKLKTLGIPKFIATGQHVRNGTQYRFMVMPRFSTDVQKIFEKAGCFSRKSVYCLGLRMIDALEYIHVNDYVHADIKASNMLMGYKSGKTLQDLVYLVDYGLAYKYKIDGMHKEYKEDPRKVHDGTIEFTSIDAHKGVSPSRRGDLEILGYCMLQWLCRKLPWEDKLSNKEYVRDSKIKYMDSIPSLMKKCFPTGDIPAELGEYLQLVKKLRYDEAPNYSNLKSVLTRGLKKEGCRDDGKLDLPLEGQASGSASSVSSPRKRKSTDANLDTSSRVKSLKAAAKQKPSSPRGRKKQSSDDLQMLPTASPARTGTPKGTPGKKATSTKSFTKYGTTSPPVKSPKKAVPKKRILSPKGKAAVSPRNFISPPVSPMNVVSPPVSPRGIISSIKARRLVSPEVSPEGVRSPGRKVVSPKAIAKPRIPTEESIINRGSSAKKTVIRRRLRRGNKAGISVEIQTSPSLMKR